MPNILAPEEQRDKVNSEDDSHWMKASHIKIPSPKYQKRLAYIPNQLRKITAAKAIGLSPTAAKKMQIANIKKGNKEKC